MKKFLAVVKHEYRKIVMKWTFLIGTLLFPVIGLCFAIVPAIIFSLKGEPTRIIVVDPTNKIAPRMRENLSAEKIVERAKRAAAESSHDIGASSDERMKHGADQLAAGFVFIDYDPDGKHNWQIRNELTQMAVNDQIDAYLIVPEDFESQNAKFEFRSRKAGDFVVGELMEDALNQAVRSQRLAEANISESQLEEISRNVDVESKSINERGEEKDSEMLFLASLVIGMMIYITLTIYGQVIMGAVVEEKETRIAEILFSSARPFELMLGKLVGVGLAGLTQLGIWVISLGLVVAFLTTQGNIPETIGSLPSITPLMIGLFLIYFLLGYFIYASIFALIGSMVTTVQEGGQFAFPPIMLMLIGFYFCFAVIRDPNSSLSLWVSMSPLFAPLTMPVRILAEMPPLWQLALSIIVNVIAIAGFVWIAARVYRVGMLMYGKRASIPEVWKWIRQP